MQREFMTKNSTKKGPYHIYDIFSIYNPHMFSIQILKYVCVPILNKQLYLRENIIHIRGKTFKCLGVKG